jgi:hypothetical protein
MLTVVPMTVVLLLVLGLAVVVASIARMVALESQVQQPRFLVDPGQQERPRVAA